MLKLRFVDGASVDVISAEIVHEEELIGPSDDGVTISTLGKLESLLVSIF